MPPSDKLKQSYYDDLSQEEVQEKKLAPQTDTIIHEKDAELIIGREREYRDVEKHWIRKNVWLKTAQNIAKHKPHGNPLRYLTLPAYYRIDVSMLLQHGLLQVTEKNAEGTAKEIYVAAFETDEIKYGRMSGQVPSYKMFGLGKIEDALTDTNNRYYQKLLDLFPFDIINLDLTNTLAPRREGPYSKTMRAIEEIFQRQAPHGSKWALFLTFRNMPDQWSDHTLQQLFDNLQKNLNDHALVRETFYKRYQQINVEGLRKENAKLCISQAVVKWLVDRAHHYSLKLESISCCFYSRYPKGVSPYDIYKHVYVFSRGKRDSAIIPTKGTPSQSWMLSDLADCVHKHKCVDVEEKLAIIDDKWPIFQQLEQDIKSLCDLID